MSEEEVHRAPRPAREELRLCLSRGLLLGASLPLSLAAGATVVLHPSSFGWSDSTLYAVPGCLSVVAALGFVASFAPFDRPQCTPRWSRPLTGALCGAAVAGLFAFTASFLVLAPLCLALAAMLHFGSRAVAAGPPDLELPTTSLSPAELAALADPPWDWRVGLPLGVGAAFGVLAVLLWRPAPGAVLVSAPGAGVAAVVSRDLDRRQAGRVVRHGRSVEVNGHDLRLHVSLDRPRILLRLRDQNLVIEPCLMVEEGSTDGFPVVWALNGVRLEPGAPALVDFVEGRNRAYVRVAYSRGRVTRGALASKTAFLGGRAGADSIAATLEIEVDLDWGQVTIDARTRLERPASAGRASLGWIRLASAPRVACALGFDEGLQFMPDEEPLRQGQGARFFSCGAEQDRLLQAKRGTKGPYETLRVGSFHDWLVLPSLHTQTLVVAPDWRRLASRRPSRSAGFGLAENSLRLWREGESLNVLFDVASGRYGGGFLPATLPAGLYRNRIVLHPLRREDPGQVAQRILARLELAEASGAAVEQVARPALPGLGAESEGDAALPEPSLFGPR